MKKILVGLLACVCLAQTAHGWQLLTSWDVNQMRNIIEENPIHYAQVTPQDGAQINKYWRWWVDHTLQYIKQQGREEEFEDIFDLLGNKNLNLKKTHCVNASQSVTFIRQWFEEQRMYFPPECTPDDALPWFTLIENLPPQLIEILSPGAAAFQEMDDRGGSLIFSTDDELLTLHEFGHWLGFGDLYYNGYESLQSSPEFGTNFGWGSIMREANSEFSCTDADGMINMVDLSLGIERGAETGWLSLCNDGTRYVKGRVHNREPFLVQTRDSVTVFSYNEDGTVQDAQEVHAAANEEEPVAMYLVPLFDSWHRDPDGKVVTVTSLNNQIFRAIYQGENTFLWDETDKQFVHIEWKMLTQDGMGPSPEQLDWPAMLGAQATIRFLSGEYITSPWLIAWQSALGDVAAVSNDLYIHYRAGSPITWVNVMTWGDDFRDPACPAQVKFITQLNSEKYSTIEMDASVLLRDIKTGFIYQLGADKQEGFTPAELKGKQVQNCLMQYFNSGWLRVGEEEKQILNQYVYYPVLLSREQFKNLIKQQRNAQKKNSAQTDKTKKARPIPYHWFEASRADIWYDLWMLKADFAGKQIWQDNAVLRQVFADMEYQLAYYSALGGEITVAQEKEWAALLASKPSVAEVVAFLSQQVTYFKNQVRDWPLPNPDDTYFLNHVFMSPFEISPAEE